MTVAILNNRSSIAREFRKLIPPGEDEVLDPKTPMSADRWLMCDGYLAGKALPAISREDDIKSWHRNFTDPAALCELILDHVFNARIVIISSESAYRGSFDMAYAGAKAALNLYVETAQLRTAGQQLVAIAPTIIIDSGMTQRRPDLDVVIARAAQRRAGRWLNAIEVASLAHFLLYVDNGAITNTVIRMNLGND